MGFPSADVVCSHTYNITLNYHVGPYLYLLFNLCSYTSMCPRTYAALYTGGNENQACRELTSSGLDDVVVRYNSSYALSTGSTTALEFKFDSPKRKDPSSPRLFEDYGFCLRMVCDPGSRWRPIISYNDTECSQYTVTFRHFSCIDLHPPFRLPKGLRGGALDLLRQALLCVRRDLFLTGGAAGVLRVPVRQAGHRGLLRLPADCCGLRGRLHLRSPQPFPALGPRSHPTYFRLILDTTIVPSLLIGAAGGYFVTRLNHPRLVGLLIGLATGITPALILYESFEYKIMESTRLVLYVSIIVQMALGGVMCAAFGEHLTIAYCSIAGAYLLVRVRLYDVLIGFVGRKHLHRKVSERVLDLRVHNKQGVR